jgi:hypothetical protein
MIKQISMMPEELAKMVRLKPWEIEIIQIAFRSAFPKGDHLWLFGSRVDLVKKGGDIDLYIETQELDVKKLNSYQNDLYKNLLMGLGEQKIDVVVKFGEAELLIYQEAKANGVQLV